jgi:hypothetical protein
MRKIITLYAWHCNFNECNTTFYLPDEYTITPYCPECGCDNEEHVTEIGVYKIKQIKEGE